MAERGEPPTEGHVRSLTTDSILSEGTQVSRDSFMSMSSKLLSMESELDKTLRDLDGAAPGNAAKAKSPGHSKSPSASRRFPAGGRQATAAAAAAAAAATSSRRRSGSIDPLASSRRSSSIDARDPEQKVRELAERVETLEKENQLLETKYSQQRKRINLVSGVLACARA